MPDQSSFQPADFLHVVNDPGTGGKCFITRQHVRFGHIDPAGIAYFPRIFNYIHEAFEDLWESYMGVRYSELVGERRIGFPLVHSEADFKRGLQFGDRPTVRVTCFRLGRSSLGLRYLYEVGGEPCVEARMITACIDLDAIRSIEIPDGFRRRFAVLLEPDAAQPGD